MKPLEHSFAVFPYLKTSRAVEISGVQFRSTDDLEGMSITASKALSEITGMLFLQNSLRVKSAVYAALPQLSDYLPANIAYLEQLKTIQAVLAYCYAAPHPSLGNPFLPLENSDILVFTPEMVPSLLVWPDNHTIDVESHRTAPLVGNPEHMMHAGYGGYRNFTLPFWVTLGCRLYPSVPHLSLNISQDLSTDVPDFRNSEMYGTLFNLLRRKDSEFLNRIITAISWFNRTISLATDEPTAIVQLAIAFEALLKLPSSEKTNRFVDAIALLLGRVPRLDLWADQLYNLRSTIAHKGKVEHARFVVPGQKGKESYYHSVLVFGRQIFQACLSAVLFGEHISQKSDLSTKLFTNAERFALVCRRLSDTGLSPSKRLQSIGETIAELNRYRYIPETGLTLQSLADAVNLSCSCLIDSGELLVRFGLADLQEAATTKNPNGTLGVVQRLAERHGRHASGMSNAENSVGLLLEVVWHYTFQGYFRWKEAQRSNDISK